MMNGAVAWSWTIRGLDPATRLVLLSLAGRANNTTYECFPSHKKLAEDTETSVSTVKRSLSKLEERGVLLVEKRQREDGGDTSNIYRLAVSIEYIHPDGKKEYEGVGQIEPGVGQIGLPPKVTGELPLTLKNELSSEAKASSVRGSKISDDWWPEKQGEETAKVTALWPDKFLRQQVEQFIGHHQSRGTLSKNWNRHWATWALKPWKLKELREFQENERSGPRGPFGDNEIANAASRLLGELAGTRQ